MKRQNYHSRGKKVVKEQPRKDSRSKRVNMDNVRESKAKKVLSEEERQEMAGKISKFSASNDVSWYANNPELLRAAASLPFSTYAGQAFPYNKAYSVPGICALRWVPVVDAGFEAPINQAANSIYSFTVHANSRNQNYDAVDEMLLILAGSQVFAAIALGVRAYGLMRNYSQLDKYTPSALLEASLFDPDDLQAHYSQMWFDLNELIARTQQIWIPNTMPVTTRWFWLCSNVYKDASSAKAQYYMFVPQLFYQYDETGSDTGGQLTPVNWYNYANTKVQLNTWEQYTSMVKSMINALINSQDRGIIFGDILKAYGADKLYAMASMPVDYTTTPVYDTEVLTQIENATIWGMTIPGNIVQDPDTNYLTQQWSSLAIPAAGNITPAFALGLGRTVLNFHTPDIPRPEDIMVATRLKTQGMRLLSKPTTSTAIVVPDAAGTEIVYGIDLYHFDATTAPAKLSRLSIGSYYSQPAGHILSQLMSFDWAPWLYQVQPTAAIPTEFWTTVGNSYDQQWVYPFGDYDQFTYVQTKDLQEMHRTAVYSEFGVPVLI